MDTAQAVWKGLGMDGYELTAADRAEAVALADKIRAGTYSRAQIAAEIARREQIAAEWLAGDAPFETLAGWGQMIVSECRRLVAGYRAVLAMLDGEESV